MLMKIYFYRYNSRCEPDAIDSFKRLGLQVDEETIEMYKKDLLPSECAKIVSHKLINGGYTFVFTINYFPWLSEICQVINIVYISLIVDSPVLELYSESLSNSVNRVFLFDRMLYNEFEPYNNGHVFHIPLATNVRRNDKVIKNASPKDNAKFTSEISFIGSTYQEKCPFNSAILPEYEKGFVDGIINAQLGVYGYNFIEDMLTDEMSDRLLSYIPSHYEFPEKSRVNNKALLAQQYLSVKVAEQ